ncbi:MAG TPA: rhodanese-like domain-containing protein [Mycobacteriales bacterium]|nr:rhodanese-like domain-containing protein [Mycobacteriales bacterium]
MPWGTPLTLIGDSPEQVADAQRELVRIGIDRPAARATAPVGELSDGEPEQLRLATFADLAGTDGAHVLDVRRRSEWDDGHVAGAQHVPLHDLLRRMDEVPAGPVWVHCGTGFRATIAGSLLQAAGRDVVVVDEQFDRAEPSGVVLEKG